jgi:hypothetical protein
LNLTLLGTRPVAGRLRDGSSFDLAAAELTDIAARLADAHAVTNAGQ